MIIPHRASPSRGRTQNADAGVTFGVRVKFHRNAREAISGREAAFRQRRAASERKGITGGGRRSAGREGDRRTFTFRISNEAFGFMVSRGAGAEKERHHPGKWRNCLQGPWKVVLPTHDAGGVTRRTPPGGVGWGGGGDIRSAKAWKRDRGGGSGQADQALRAVWAFEPVVLGLILPAETAASTNR